MQQTQTTTQPKNSFTQQQTVLNAKNIKVSFKTPAGRVHAVRGIDFDLHRGETLAIVGESGSGKSVTSKAILGILAENAEIESGEIIFDGQDLLKVGEKEFSDIRGEKISMIFQDPLSSLNPLVKIGKQMTEAMIIKGEQKQYNAKKELNERLKILGKFMSTDENSSQNQEMINKFKAFVKQQYILENAYNLSRREVEYCIDDIQKLLIRINANVFEHINRDLLRIQRQAKLTFNDYLIKNKQSEVLQLLNDLLALVVDGNKLVRQDSAVEKLERLKVIFEKTLKRAVPNFFAMAYYKLYSGKELPVMDTKDLNIVLQEYLDKEFMNNFVSNAQKAIVNSHNETIRNKQTYVNQIDQLIKEIVETNHGRKLTLVTINKVIELVENSIDKLSNRKDNYAYSFRASFKHAFEQYYKFNKANIKEQARYDKEKEKLANKGFEPKPAGLIDLNDILGNIRTIADRVKQNFIRDIEYGNKRNFEMATRYTVDYIKSLAQAVVHKVTKEVAKRIAIRLMEEVGISNAETRYEQYPFEFSGGMRQRIVIAIALSANPQILVCDEPTTALDVTIQSQILELINNLKAKRDLSVIFITHDLGVVANMADRVAVMYAGKMVEIGTKADIFYNPRHPYTWALLSSMPDMDTEGALDAIPGTPPNMIYPPKGDAFAERNKYAMKIDFEQQPPMFKVSEHHYAATWLLHPDAPKVDLPEVIKERITRNQAKYGVYKDPLKVVGGNNDSVSGNNGSASTSGSSSTNVVANSSANVSSSNNANGNGSSGTNNSVNINVSNDAINITNGDGIKPIVRVENGVLVGVDDKPTTNVDFVTQTQPKVSAETQEQSKVSVDTKEQAPEITTETTSNTFFKDTSEPAVSTSDTVDEVLKGSIVGANDVVVETSVPTSDTTEVESITAIDDIVDLDLDAKDDDTSDMLIAEEKIEEPKQNNNTPKPKSSINIGGNNNKKGTSKNNSFFKSNKKK